MAKKKEKVEEEKEEVVKRSTKSNVMTVMLGIALFCIFSFLLLIILDKGALFGDNVPPKDEPQEVKYTNWTDYLANSKIVKAELSSSSDSSEVEKTVELTNEQVKEILKEFKKYTLYKEWFRELSDSSPIIKLTITYEKNGSEYNFILEYEKIRHEKIDEGLKALLDEYAFDMSEKEDDETNYFYSFEESTPVDNLNKYFK